MQIVMKFFETRSEKAGEPVWPTLDPGDRNAIVTALARLIAKAATGKEDDVDEGVRDE